MFKESFLIIEKSFIDYKGPYSMYLAICMLSMLYIFLTEEDKKIKTFLIGYSLVAFFLVICNPIVVNVLKKVLTIYTYWRIYWIFPIGFIIAFAAVKLIFSISDKKKRIVTIFSIIITIMASGNCAFKYFKVSEVKKFDYLNYNFAKVNNLYKIPDEALEVSIIISEHNLQNKKVMAPEELVPYIRQYDAKVKLVYGRDPWGYSENWRLDMLNKGKITQLIPGIDMLDCNYIVFRKETKFDDDISKYGYELLGETEKYDIYVKK